MPAKWDMQLHHIAAGIVADGRLVGSQRDAIGMRSRVMLAVRTFGVTAASPGAVRPVLSIGTASLAGVVPAGRMF